MARRATMMATARWVTTINEDGNGATGDEVDDDGNDDDCGDGRRQGRWRRRDVIRPIATGNDNNDVNGDSATGNEVDDDGDGAKGSTTTMTMITMATTTVTVEKTLVLRR